MLVFNGGGGFGSGALIPVCGRLWKFRAGGAWAAHPKTNAVEAARRNDTAGARRKSNI